MKILLLPGKDLEPDLDMVPQFYITIETQNKFDYGRLKFKFTNLNYAIFFILRKIVIKNHKHHPYRHNSLVVEL